MSGKLSHDRTTNFLIIIIMLVQMSAIIMVIILCACSQQTDFWCAVRARFMIEILSFIRFCRQNPLCLVNLGGVYGACSLINVFDTLNHDRSNSYID